MKFKKFLPIALAALCALAGCSSGKAPITKFEISNKEALEAEWHVGDASRLLEFNIEPEQNVNQLISDGLLTFVSTAPEVAMVSGRAVFPVAEGMAIITANLYDKVGEEGKVLFSDSVEVNIQASLKEPAYVKATLGEVLAATYSSDDGAKTAYLTTVKVTGFGSKPASPATSPDKYGNLLVTDTEGGNATIVYGSSADASALSFATAGMKYKFTNPQNFITNNDTKAIAVNDVLEMVVIRCDYKTTVEITGIVRSINGRVISNGVKTSDEVNAIAVTDNANTYCYSVTGVVTAWASGKSDGTKYGNLYVTTKDATEAVYVYGASATATALSINAEHAHTFTNPKDFLTNTVTKDIKIGDTVTVLGYRLDYGEVKEFTGVITAVTPAPAQ